MPSPSASIHEILGPQGLLSRALPDFEFRPSQLQMALLTAEAIEGRKKAVLEAGTGTGKTLGYLVPLVLSGKKAVISTGTKNLQEQIFTKDVPLLSKAAGLPIDATLMKGRKNYLCLHRYHQWLAHPSLLRPDLEVAKTRIASWLRETVHGDRAELDWMSDDNPLWDVISATSDQCLGSECLHAEGCYLNAVRREAARSPLVIVNHHLFFADLMVKEGGFGEIIPRFEIALFDEAHDLEDIATIYFGQSLSTNQLQDLADDLDKGRGGDISAAERKGFRGQAAHIRLASEALGRVFAAGHDRDRLTPEALAALGQGPGHDLKRVLRRVREQAGRKAPASALAQTWAHRAGDLEARLEGILSAEDPQWLRWYERRKKGVVLHASPLDISQSMEERLYQKVKSVVFTSATLSTNTHFDYFRSRLGLSEEVVQGIYPSHFDLETQALMYVPRDLPAPGAPGFGSAIAGRVLELLRISRGRALVLFTSHHNLNLVYSLTVKDIPYRVYRQGDAPKSKLLEDFRRDTHSVLLATGSFWQGVDVPGEALSCLIIDKLPFDSPGDPLIAARIEAIRSRGGNPFMEYQIPSAVISLKQGLGRLIRSSTDCGLYAVLDIRLVTSRYGPVFFDSLPRIPRTHELDRVKAFFNALQ